MSGDDAALPCLDEHRDGITLGKVPKWQNNVMRSRVMATNSVARRAFLRGNRLSAHEELTVSHRAIGVQCECKEGCNNGSCAIARMVHHIAPRPKADTWCRITSLGGFSAWRISP